MRRRVVWTIGWTVLLFANAATNARGGPAEYDCGVGRPDTKNGTCKCPATMHPARGPRDAAICVQNAKPRDLDGDGLVGATDRCPAAPEDRDGFQDADGCPDLDNDQDGLPDRDDDCPSLAEDRAGAVDGCPEAGGPPARDERLTIVVKLATDAAVPGLEVRRDGIRLDPSQYGVPVFVEPGAHEVAASAPGHRPWKTRIELGIGARPTEILVPALALYPVDASDETVISVSAADPATRRPRGRTQRRVSLAAGSLGVVALAVGAAYGLKARSRWDDVTSGCVDVGGRFQCDAVGRQAEADARSAARISNVAFVGGGVAVVAGILLYATAPAARSTSGTIVVDASRSGATVMFARGF